MSIIFNDQIQINAPKHIDARKVVGIDPLLVYDTKEDIPLSYRYESLTVFDDDTKITWQLVGGITDENWIEVGQSYGLVTKSGTITSNPIDLESSNFNGVFTILYYNGIFLNPALYSISSDELTLTFEPETDDVYYLIGFATSISIPSADAPIPIRKEFTPSNGQTAFTLDYNLTVTASVFKNGQLLMSTEYSGIGTTTLTVVDPLTVFDNLVVTDNIVIP